MLRTVRKVLISLVAIAAVLFLGLFAQLTLVDSPTFAWRVLSLGESDLGDMSYFPVRPIAAPDRAAPLERSYREFPEPFEYPYGDGLRRETLDALIDRSATNAFLILQDDRILFERYPTGAEDDLHTSFSAAKSFVSTLIGAAIADGLIGSVEDRVVQYVPELAGRGLDDLTIRDLLLMNTGIRYRLSDDTPLWRKASGDDARSYYAPDLRRIALSVRADAERPVGAAFYYNNYHLLLEGIILERVTGMSVASYLQDRIWKPMGAEFPASWSLDSANSGFEKMESGINARARDYARFGLMFLHGGTYNGQEILPGAWVRDATRAPDPRPWLVYDDLRKNGTRYGYHWWILATSEGAHDFYAHGKYGQFVYVAPRKRAVIVRLGNEPDHSLHWPLAMRAVVDALP